MFFSQPLNVFYWILKRFPAFGKACCQATIIFEILSRNDDFGFGRVARSNKTVNSSTQQINYDPCLNVKILTKQDLQTHFSLLVPE